MSLEEVKKLDEIEKDRGATLDEKKQNYKTLDNLEIEDEEICSNWFFDMYIKNGYVLASPNSLIRFLKATTGLSMVLHIVLYFGTQNEFLIVGTALWFVASIMSLLLTSRTVFPEIVRRYYSVEDVFIERYRQNLEELRKDVKSEIAEEIARRV